MMLNRTVPPAIKPVANFEIPLPERRVMQNGMPLNVIRTGSEDVVRFDLLVRGGQWCQEYPLQAMFTNRMLREGSAGMTSSEIAEKLDYYGAWLDLSSSVNYGFVTLYSLGKYFPQTLEVLASMVKEPVFPEKELSVVVEMNRQQFKVNAQRVDVMARKGLNRALFGIGHPLGRYAEIITKRWGAGLGRVSIKDPGISCSLLSFSSDLSTISYLNPECCRKPFAEKGL